MLRVWRGTRGSSREAALPPIMDDVALNQSQNNSFAVLFQKAGDVIDWEAMIDEQVADDQGAFGVVSEMRAVLGPHKRIVAHLKAISARLFCLDISANPTKKHGSGEHWCVIRLEGFHVLNRHTHGATLRFV